jgi:hypothetical protein
LLLRTVEARSAIQMTRRTSKTAYFLNRTLNRLALIAERVRFPRSAGVWVMVAEAVRAPWEVAELLTATYPEMMKQNPTFIALLTDFDVEEFESELAKRDLLVSDRDAAGPPGAGPSGEGGDRSPSAEEDE